MGIVMTTFTNYGHFNAYTPSFEGIPTGSALRTFKYYKNATDMDWYDLSRGLPLGTATYAVVNSDTGVIRIASNDPTMLSPVGGTFISLPFTSDFATLR